MNDISLILLIVAMIVNVIVWPTVVILLALENK